MCVYVLGLDRVLWRGYASHINNKTQHKAPTTRGQATEHGRTLTATTPPFHSAW